MKTCRCDPPPRVLLQSNPPRCSLCRRPLHEGGYYRMIAERMPHGACVDPTKPPAFPAWDVVTYSNENA